MKNHLHERRGFTLIEMLVTITIIVILAGLSLGGFKFVTAKQAKAQAEIQIKLISKALEEYKLDNGEYPPSSSGNGTLYTKLYYEGSQDATSGKIYLAELDPDHNKQGWTQGSDASVTIIDPWGKPYIYRAPGTINPDFDLISLGPDGKPLNDDPMASESKDDIRN